MKIKIFKLALDLELTPGDIVSSILKRRKSVRIDEKRGVNINVY